jgi:DNA-binding transcriptional ArsR family regulator
MDPQPRGIRQKLKILFAFLQIILQYCNVIKYQLTMGLTKTEGYTQAQIELATIAKVLGHPARIAIVQHLLEINACIGNDLMEVLPLSQPTISRHLAELKKVGIIQGTIEGSSMNYCINAHRWREIRQMLGGLLGMDPGEQCC